MSEVPLYLWLLSGPLWRSSPKCLSHRHQTTPRRIIRSRYLGPHGHPGGGARFPKTESRIVRPKSKTPNPKPEAPNFKTLNRPGVGGAPSRTLSPSRCPPASYAPTAWSRAILLPQSHVGSLRRKTVAGQIILG